MKTTCPRCGHEYEDYTEDVSFFKTTKNCPECDYSFTDCSEKYSKGYENAFMIITCPRCGHEYEDYTEDVSIFMKKNCKNCNYPDEDTRTPQEKE